MNKPFCIATGTRSGSRGVALDLFRFSEIMGRPGEGGAVLERYNPEVCRRVLKRPDLYEEIKHFFGDHVDCIDNIAKPYECYSKEEAGHIPIDVDATNYQTAEYKIRF